MGDHQKRGPMPFHSMSAEQVEAFASHLAAEAARLRGARMAILGHPGAEHLKLEARTYERILEKLREVASKPPVAPATRGPSPGKQRLRKPRVRR